MFFLIFFFKIAHLFVGVGHAKALLWRSEDLQEWVLGIKCLFLGFF